LKLRGYSGCNLEIIEIDGKKCVRKIAADISYNDRLQEQKRKQASLVIPGFKTCDVYDDGYINGHYFFTMEYINGKTLAEEMEQMELSELEDVIADFVDVFCSYNAIDNNVRLVFDNKLREIDGKIREMCQGQPDETISSAIRLLRDYSWEYVIQSPCHGDMTMENILIQRGRMYLIDFLDSFYDSWMIDAAKLLQDAEYMWSYRGRERSSNLSVRMTVFRDLLIEGILEMPDGRQILDTVYHILLLNYLRIVPYVNSSFDKEYIVDTIKKIMVKINEEGLI
jgi:thiamine kinase-like enzyme